MNDTQEQMLREVHAASIETRTILSERCPREERRISRLEKAFIGIASVIVVSIVSALLSGFFGG